MDAHSTARAPVRVKGRILRYPSGTIPLSVEQTPMPAGNAVILAVLGAYFGLMLAIAALAFVAIPSEAQVTRDPKLPSKIT